MSKKYFEDQFDDEEVRFVFRKHPVIMRKGLILSMFGILAGLAPGLITLEFSWFYGGIAGGFVLGALLFSPWYIAWYFSVFIVTNQRFIQITQKGLFHRSVSDLGLQHIQTVNYEIAGLEQTMLGFGTIVVQTYMGDLVVHNVHHPAKIQKKIVSVLRDESIIPDDIPLAMKQEQLSDE